jgi:hypothetical protein
VKKLWLVVGLVALGGLASQTYADVQNIRLSGDIRIRGYFLDDAGANEYTDQAKANTSFISQRTRVSVEADLEDHVLVVVTLKAEGLWGADNSSVSSSGAGKQFDPDTGLYSGNRINRRWDLGVTEAYVQLNEVFYTPATLKIGRQYLNYGHGLILSSAEQEYNYDAGRLVLDYYPLTIDLVAAELVNNQAFSPTPNKIADQGNGELLGGALDLLFLNARYELTDSIIKNVEAYFGWVAQGSSGAAGFMSSRVPPSIFGASPWIIGARTDLQPADGFQVWLEAAYEGGAGGDTILLSGDSLDKSISAYILNIGGRYTMKNTQWTPALNANYIWASGGGKSASGDFRPWLDYADGYNGYLFGPALSNIHIFNLGASVKPYENTTLSLQGYYYMRADHDTGVGVSPSNINVDFGGLAFAAQGASRGLGWEIDSILGYDYSKDVRVQLVYGAFIPDGAFNKGNADATAHEVRGELNVKF